MYDGAAGVKIANKGEKARQCQQRNVRCNHEAAECHQQNLLPGQHSHPWDGGVVLDNIGGEEMF